VFWNEFQTIFEGRHHTKTQQIYFHDAHVGAIFLVPLHDNTTGHGRRFEGHDGIQLPLADHHAARVLAQMTWQVLNAFAQFAIFLNPGMAKV